MTSIYVRPAAIDDAAPFSELSGQLGYPSTEADIVIRLRTILQREDHLVLAAERDGKVVGWLHAFVALQIESPPFAEICGLVVDQAVRGHGAGRQLVRAATAWAGALGLGQIRVRSNMVRKESHQFYQHLGFAQVKAQMVFSMAADMA